MIEVSEESAIAQIETAQDFHGLLLSLHGRTLRVRTVNTANSYNYNYRVDGVNRTVSDSTGILMGASLISEDRYRISSGISSYSTLSIALSWGEPISVDHELSLIEVFQEDSGSWKLIHRGSEWVTATTEELKL